MRFGWEMQKLFNDLKWAVQMVENVSLSVVVGSIPTNSTIKNKLGLYLSGRGQGKQCKGGFDDSRTVHKNQ